MSEKTATLFGASGLTGSHLLELLLLDTGFAKINVVVRRSLGRKHEKMQEFMADFSNTRIYEESISGCQVVFCAIGTTNKKVKGDKDAYKKIDYDIPVTAARVAAKMGAESFVLVSSVGANSSNNNNFYLKLKGVIEEAVCKEAIPMIHIMRPSLLIGKRNERRWAEKLAQAIYPVISFFLSGKARKYKSISAENLARAMLAAARRTTRGIFIYEYDDLMKLARS